MQSPHVCMLVAVSDAQSALAILFSPIVRILNSGAVQSGERGGSPGPPPFPGGKRSPPGRGGVRPPLRPIQDC